MTGIVWLLCSRASDRNAQKVADEFELAARKNGGLVQGEDEVVRKTDTAYRGQVSMGLVLPVS